MHLTESWVTGLQNGGATGWTISSVTSNPIDYVAPDAPQIDREAFWAFGGPGSTPTSPPVSTCRVDRPVDWAVHHLLGNRRAGDVVRLPLRSPVEDSGRADDGVIRIALPQVCLGGGYLGILRLTDDAGNVSVYAAPGLGRVIGLVAGRAS